MMGAIYDNYGIPTHFDIMANFVNHAFFVKNYLPTVTMEPIFF